MIRKLIPWQFLGAMLFIVAIACLHAGCAEEGSQSYEGQVTKNAVKGLAKNQPTPSDINYSMERRNLRARAYWVNGQRDKAMRVLREDASNPPLGYILLLTNSGSILAQFTVDGKITSLNSYLTPDSEYQNANISHWLPDVDGAYGANDDGIFFFTPDGKYIEYKGNYLYSDISFSIENQLIKVAK